MIKKVALLAVAGVLSLSVAAHSFAEDAPAGVRCVGGHFDPSKKVGEVDGQAYTIEVDAAACLARDGKVLDH